MRTIWKFPIPVADDIFEVLMPKGAQLLHVGMDDSMTEVWLWALVETEVDKEIRRFRIYGTGHQIKPNVGTGYNTYDTYGIYSKSNNFEPCKRKQ